jgi:glucose-6-phosphate isomerase
MKVKSRRRGTAPSPPARVLLDYSGCLAERVGRSGLTPAEIKRGCRAAGGGMRRLRRELDAGRYGFDAVLDDRRSQNMSVREGRRLARLADVLVVNGIGGSALGPLAIQTALRPRRRLVVLDNIDPEGVAGNLSSLDPRRTAVNAITKSGSTAETMANLLILLEWMERALGPRHVRHWAATTDPRKGDLLTIARRLGIPPLPIPENVGGRFSVLTPVGLLPAAFLGIDVIALIEGARSMRRHCWSAPPEKNIGAVGAVVLFLMATKKRRNIQVLMPYCDALVHLVGWYCQLWAESLGKRVDRRGRLVETGQTPVAALGATDQHSQVQLYMEGPHDKVVTFLEVRSFHKDVRIPRLQNDLSSTGYLGGKTLGELIRAERKATEIALAAAGRPTLTYVIPTLSAHMLGQLFYLFEFQTALAGELYGINAFDQPGVEAGKIATYALMGRSGFEARAVELRCDERLRRAIV